MFPNLLEEVEQLLLIWSKFHTFRSFKQLYTLIIFLIFGAVYLRIRPLIIEAMSFQWKPRIPITNSILKVYQLVLEDKSPKI